jgi:hypothetical protein
MGRLRIDSSLDATAPTDLHQGGYLRTTTERPELTATVNSTSTANPPCSGSAAF